MAQFNVGDTVRLKSGGPTMTVGETVNGKLSCHWFNQNGAEYTAKLDIFTVEMLKTVQMSNP
jgi:uncharacterized protein YodC (DUF2158 family)